MSFTNWSSSDCTKYFQRNSDSAAPFSGFQGAACAQALAQSSNAGPVSAPAAASAVPVPTSVRRVIIVMDVPPFVLGGEPLPRGGIEQMHEPGIGFEPDLVARLERMTFAESCNDLGIAELGDNLDFRTGRLNHLDHRLRAIVGNGEVLRPYAIDRFAAVAARRRRGQRQARAAAPLEFEFAVGADRAVQEIHRRRADKAGKEKILRPVARVFSRAGPPPPAPAHPPHRL